jgi:hypothetical protein
MAEVTPNLEHAIMNDCTDPDCELHNLDVAQDEGAITNHEVAYFLAGAHALGNTLIANAIDPLVRAAVEQSVGMAIAEVRRKHMIGLS